MKLLLLFLFWSSLDLSQGSNDENASSLRRKGRKNARILQNDKIQVAFAFEYNLYFNGGNYTSHTATMTVEDAVTLALNDALQEYGSADVTLDSLGSSSTVDCTNATLAKYPTLDSCVQSDSTLVLEVESTITSDVAQRAVIQLVLAFIADFNKKHSDLYISFEYPIQIEATVEVELLGVNGSIESQSDLQLFEDTFQEILEPILQKNQFVSFNLTEVLVLYQVSGIYNQSDLGRQLQTAGDGYNRVSVFVRATCQGTDKCTHDNFQRYLNNKGPSFSNDVQLSLKHAGPKQGSVYFSGMTGVFIGGSYVNRTIDKVPNTTVTVDSEMAEDKNPPWLWPLIVINLVILISFCFCVASRKQHLKQVSI